MSIRDLIYDVGMHRGEDTEFYLKKGYRVIAFEADPNLNALARERFKTSIATGQLNIVEGAICRQGSSNSVDFYRNENDEWGTIYPSWAQRNRQMGRDSWVVQVPTVDFRECLNRFGMPYYLKVDIEGADMICLESLAGFPDKPDYVSIESNKIDFSAVVRELEVLSRLGYQRFAPIQQQTIGGRRYNGRSLQGQEIAHVFVWGASGSFGNEVLGRYMSKDEVVERYRKIFRWYELLGDSSPLLRSPVGRVLYKVFWRVQRQFGIAVPGWYDTHASLHVANT
jgi:FkbM family methyltransferase